LRETTRKALLEYRRHLPLHHLIGTTNKDFTRKKKSGFKGICIEVSMPAGAMLLLARGASIVAEEGE